MDDEVGVAAGGRRHVGIQGKSWAGSAVWAKLAQYPWWPAQVSNVPHDEGWHLSLSVASSPYPAHSAEQIEHFLKSST